MATYDVVPGPQYDIVLLRLQLTSVHAKLQTVCSGDPRRIILFGTTCMGSAEGTAWRPASLPACVPAHCSPAYQPTSLSEKRESLQGTRNTSCQSPKHRRRSSTTSEVTLVSLSVGPSDTLLPSIPVLASAHYPPEKPDPPIRCPASTNNLPNYL